MDAASPFSSNTNSTTSTGSITPIDSHEGSSNGIEPNKLKERLIPISEEQASSLDSDSEITATMRKTFSGIKSWFKSIFSSQATAQRSLGKPTTQLTSALKFIERMNVLLSKTTFEKVTPENLNEYIEALKENKVLAKNIKGELVRVDPEESLEGKGAEDTVTVQDLQNSKLLGQLESLARSFAVNVTGETSWKGIALAKDMQAVEVLETAQKTIKAWEATIIKAGEGLSDAEFRGLVQAATDVVAEEVGETNRTFLEQNTAKLWANNMVERFTGELADTLKPIMTNFESQVEAEIKRLTEALATDLKNKKIQEFAEGYSSQPEPNAAELKAINEEVALELKQYKTAIQQKANINVIANQNETLVTAMQQVNARAKELNRFTGTSTEDAKETILQKLLANPTFSRAHQEMSEAVQKVGNDHRTFSTVGRELLDEIATLHTAIQAAGKGSDGAPKGEAAVERDFENANKGLEELIKVGTSFYSLDDPRTNAENTIARADQQYQALNEISLATNYLLRGNKDAIQAAENVATQAGKALDTLNSFAAPAKQATLKPSIVNSPVTKELEEELLDRIEVLLGNEENGVASSPTLLRGLLLNIAQEKDGLVNVLGQEVTIGNLFTPTVQRKGINVDLTQDKDSIQLYGFTSGARDSLANLVKEKRKVLEAKKQETLKKTHATAQNTLNELNNNTETASLENREVTNDTGTAQRNIVYRFFAAIADGIVSVFAGLGKGLAHRYSVRAGGTPTNVTPPTQQEKEKFDKFLDDNEENIENIVFDPEASGDFNNNNSQFGEKLIAANLGEDDTVEA